MSRLAAAALALWVGCAQAHCESPDPPGDLREVRCTLEATGSPQAFRFTADFGGSHDDTTLEMRATLDGAPLACAAGSKMSSSYEDGNVRLECRFTLAAAAGTRHALGVTLSWRHAQYVGFGLASD